MKKPIHRSPLRIWGGSVFYALQKYYSWHLSGTSFANELESPLPIEVFTHKTILRRQLKDIEMWMQENKIENLKIAIKHLNGLVIKPGERLSYWRQIGKPKKSKGYLEGMILHDGAVKSGIGGGLCQLSNLLFWMTVHTPLTVTERRRHAYDVFPDVKRKQPFGTGATCAYPNIDLQIKNDTNQQFQLSLEVTNKYLVGKWLSDKSVEFRYKVFEKDHEIKHEIWSGYTRNNKIYRQVIDKESNKEIQVELITENQALMMYNPFIESSTDDDNGRPLL